MFSKTTKLKSYTVKPEYHNLIEYGMGDVMQMVHIYKFIHTSHSFKMAHAVAFAL